MIAMASNDGLAAGARNIGELLVRKNYYFVPFGQDNARAKPSSLVADFSKIPETVEAALRGEQIQPAMREETRESTPRLFFAALFKLDKIDKRSVLNQY